MKLKLYIQLEYKKLNSQVSLNSFIKFLLKSFNEVASLIDFGSSFHALAPRKLKDRCPVWRRHLIKSKSSRFLVVRLWICERFWNFRDRYAGAPSLRHLYIMTQSLNLGLWWMSSHPNDLNPSEMWSYFFKPSTILAAKFWRSCNFLMLLFEVLLHTKEQ